MENLISENINKIFRKRKDYKCVVFIDENKGTDKIVDAFEIKDYSMRLAYITAHEIIKLKYHGMGCDVRIYPINN